MEDTVRVRTRTGGDVTLTGEQIQQFKSRLHGPLVRPGEPGYDEARSIWNGMIDKRPALIARCTGTADVIDAVDLAREHDLLISVRGGGHNIAGTAITDGGLMIDLTPMKGVRVDPANRRVLVQPGTTWSDVDRETQPFGLAVPSGIISTTGVAGLTLGGGFGWLTRTYGYTCDNLRSVDLVTAEGRFLRASAEENADLFWGLRGGGGNFGIVTAFEFEAQPLGPTVVAGLVLHPMERVEEVYRLFRELTTSAPDELTSLLIVRIAPPAPFLPPEVHGKPVAGIAVSYSGSVEEGERIVRPLKEFGEPLADTIGPKPFSVHQSFLDSGQPHGRHYYWKAEYVAEPGDDLGNVIIEHCKNFTSPHSATLMMHLGGAAKRTPTESTAVAHRNADYIAVIQAAWEGAAESDTHIQWARDYHAELARFSTGTYVNFLNQDDGHDRTRHAYAPSTYERLVALKDRYDPNNMFQTNKNIKPSEEPSQPQERAAVAAND